jgi:hypothetical protein
MFVASDDLHQLPLELIERELESMAAQVNATHARWLTLVREFDRREGWANTGCRSTSEWVAWRCALNPRSAREHVRVAKALGELPAIDAEFAAGRLSYSKVRALTRIADERSEDELLEMARHATAAQLERIVRAAKRVSDAAAAEQQRGSFVRYFWDVDGTLRVEAKLPPDDGALFLRALEAARETLHELHRGELEEAAQDRGSAEPRDAGALNGPSEPVEPPPPPTNRDGLALMSEAMLLRPPSGLTGGERYQVVIHVEADGHTAIEDGPGLAPATAKRLGCDASVVAMVERDGVPLSVGRRTRSIPPSMRRALIARDGHCQFPGCERRRFVDGHHIIPWFLGGETSLDNLVLLCRHHHGCMHEGGFSMARSPDGSLTFFRPDGVEIPRVPASASAPLPTLTGADAGPLLTGSGEPMDLRACVDAALEAVSPSQPRSSLNGRPQDAHPPGADAGDAREDAPDG